MVNLVGKILQGDKSLDNSETGLNDKMKSDRSIAPRFDKYFGFARCVAPNRPECDDWKALHRNGGWSDY